MPNFALHHIDAVKGKIDFFLLEVDGVIQYEAFEKELKEDGGYNSELISIQIRMQEMAEMKLLPNNKCKKIGYDEYELKTKNLRCYLFHEKHKGRIIVTLAKKKPGARQQKDINKFRKIKDQYLNQ